MASIANYKCPACGGPLHFDSESQKLKCDYCDSLFHPSEIETLYDKKRENKSSDIKEETVTQDELTGIRAFKCPSCGAEILVDENTAATSCPYCGNPTINEAQLEGILKPDYVIPFKIKKEDAIASLKDFYKGKPFLPKSFSSLNHISEIKGLYVPFWLYDKTADAIADFHTTTSVSHMEGDYEVTETSHYQVHREANIQFEKVPADASSKMKDEFMDAVEPYNYEEIVPFQKSYLAGYYADKYDVSAKQNEERIQTRIHNSSLEYLTSTVVGYGSVALEKESVSISDSRTCYAFLPVWILATKWNNKNFLFVMNAQTGKMIGDDLPIDKKKLLFTFLALTILFAVLLSILFQVI